RNTDRRSNVLGDGEARHFVLSRGEERADFKEMSHRNESSSSRGPWRAKSSCFSHLSTTATRRINMRRKARDEHSYNGADRPIGGHESGCRRPTRMERVFTATSS